MISWSIRNFTTGAVLMAAAAGLTPGLQAEHGMQSPATAPANARQAQRPPRLPPMGGMMPPDRWWDDPAAAGRLGLTSEQQKKMDIIFDDSRDVLMHSMEALRQAEASLDPLMAAGQPNESAILAQIDKVAEARATLEKNRARMLLALRAQLTQNQWLKLRSMRPDGPEGPHGRFGGPHGGFGGPHGGFDHEPWHGDVDRGPGGAGAPPPPAGPPPPPFEHGPGAPNGPA